MSARAENGIDHRLARHYAHLWIRDPLFAIEGFIEVQPGLLVWVGGRGMDGWVKTSNAVLCALSQTTDGYVLPGCSRPHPMPDVTSSHPGGNQVDDATSSVHFDNLNTSNWQSMRFKPPPVCEAA